MSRRFVAAATALGLLSFSSAIPPRRAERDAPSPLLKSSLRTTATQEATARVGLEERLRQGKLAGLKEGHEEPIEVEGLGITGWALSRKGTKRDVWSDRFGWRPLAREGKLPIGFIGIAADGLGLLGGAPEAARLAAERIPARLNDPAHPAFLVDAAQRYLDTPSGKRDDSLDRQILEKMAAAVRAVHNEFRGRNERTSHQDSDLGTIVAVALILGDTLFVVTVGDTKVFLLYSGQLVEMSQYPNRAAGTNAVESYVGMRGSITLHSDIQRGLQAGDVVGILTDGIYVPLGQSGLAQVLSGPAFPEEKVRQLMERAQSSTDDQTAMILHIGIHPMEHLWELLKHLKRITLLADEGALFGQWLSDRPDLGDSRVVLDLKGGEPYTRIELITDPSGIPSQVRITSLPEFGLMDRVLHVRWRRPVLRARIPEIVSNPAANEDDAWHYFWGLYTAQDEEVISEALAALELARPGTRLHRALSTVADLKWKGGGRFREGAYRAPQYRAQAQSILDELLRGEGLGTKGRIDRSSLEFLRLVLHQISLAQAKLSAGLEEGISRRDFMRAAVLGTALSGFSSANGAVAPSSVATGSVAQQEVQKPWDALFKKDTDRQPIPFYDANEFYAFAWKQPGRQQPVLSAIAPDGTVLGEIDDTPVGIYARRMLDPATGQTIGAYDWFYRARSFGLADRYGNPIPDLELSLVPPEGPSSPQSPQAIERVYQVLKRSADGTPIESKLIGTLQDHKLLLDNEGRPVARLEPVRLVSEKSEPPRYRFYLDGSSLMHRLFATQPTPELLQELQEHLKKLQPDTLEGKLLKADLARRLIQVDLLLGPRGSGRFSRIDAPATPDKIKEVAEALGRASMETLADLSRAEGRELLWKALSLSHPLYRLAVEGVRLAGVQDDPQLLIYFLESISRQPLNESVRSALVDGLRFQAIETPLEAAQFMDGLKPAPEPGKKEIYRSAFVGMPEEFLRLRLSGDPEKFDRAFHQAAALARARYPVTFVSLLREALVDAATKTKVRDYLVIARDWRGRPPVIVIGPDSLLASFRGGTRLEEGVFRFDSMGPLRLLLEREAEYEVSMKDLPGIDGSASRWSRLLQEPLEAWRPGETRDPEAGWNWLDLKDLSRFSLSREFHRRARSGLFDKGQKVFAQAAKDRGILVLKAEVAEEGGISVAAPIAPERLLADSTLTPYRGEVGHAFGLLPSRMGRAIRRVSFQPKPLVAETLNANIDVEGRVTIESIHRDIGTHGESGGISLSGEAVGAGVVPHEILHGWDLAQWESFSVGKWTGSLSTLFDEISWQWDPQSQEWRRRSGDLAKLVDYGFDYGATNPWEDMAITGSERYLQTPQTFRDAARAELKAGNLVPAVKYLFMKYLAFLDLDGKSVEYNIGPASPGFTIEEFKGGVDELKGRQGLLTEEQERLIGIVDRVEELSRRFQASGLEEGRRAAGRIEGLGISYAGLSKIGGKDKNEDSFQLEGLVAPDGKPLGVLAVVADGVSGGLWGDLASRLATQRIADSVQKPDFLQLLGDYEAASDAARKGDLRREIGNLGASAMKDVHQLLTDLGLALSQPTVNSSFLLEAIGLYLSSQERQERDDIWTHLRSVVEIYPEIQNREVVATTLALAIATPQNIFWFHVGDTRIYFLSGGRFLLLTPDSTQVWEEVEQQLRHTGEFTQAPDDYLKVSAHSRVQKGEGRPSALGASAQLEVSYDIRRTQGRPYRLAILTDGVTPIGDSEIHSVMQDPVYSPEHGVDLFLEKAQEKSTDNKTGLFVQSEGLPSLSPAAVPQPSGLEEHSIRFTLREAPGQLWELLRHTKILILPRESRAPADQWIEDLTGFGRWLEGQGAVVTVGLDPQMPYAMVRLRGTEIAPEVEIQTVPKPNWFNRYLNPAWNERALWRDHLFEGFPVQKTQPVAWPRPALVAPVGLEEGFFPVKSNEFKLLTAARFLALELPETAAAIIRSQRPLNHPESRRLVNFLMAQSELERPDQLVEEVAAWAVSAQREELIAAVEGMVKHAADLGRGPDYEEARNKIFRGLGVWMTEIDPLKEDLIGQLPQVRVRTQLITERSGQGIALSVRSALYAVDSQHGLGQSLGHFVQSVEDPSQGLALHEKIVGLLRHNVDANGAVDTQSTLFLIQALFTSGLEETAAVSEEPLQLRRVGVRIDQRVGYLFRPEQAGLSLLFAQFKDPDQDPVVFYVLVSSPEQALRLRDQGQVDPGRMMALSPDSSQTQAYLAIRIPSDNILRGLSINNPDDLEKGMEVAADFLRTVHGVEPVIPPLFEPSAAALLSQIPQWFAAQGWQPSRSLSPQDAKVLHEINEMA